MNLGRGNQTSQPLSNPLPPLLSLTHTKKAISTQQHHQPPHEPLPSPVTSCLKSALLLDPWQQLQINRTLSDGRTISKYKNVHRFSVATVCFILATVCCVQYTDRAINKVRCKNSELCLQIYPGGHILPQDTPTPATKIRHKYKRSQHICIVDCSILTCSLVLFSFQ